MNYRLLIADDEAVERSAIKLMISKNMSEFEVIGEAENGLEAIELVRVLRPDIILMDIKMPGVDGLSALAEIRKFDEQVRFIVLSAHNDFEYAQSALKLGADDYLLKPARFNKLAETLLKIAHKLDILQLKMMQANNMKNKIDSLRPDLESRVITSVAAGMSTSVMFMQYAQFLDIELQNCLCMVSRFPKPVADKEERARLLDAFKEKLRAICPYFLADFASGALVVLLPVDAAWSIGRIEQWGSELCTFTKNILKMLGNYHAIIGISDVAQSADLLHAAYMQAAQSAQQSSQAQINGVEQNETYLKELKLVEKIALGDLDQCRLLLQDLFSAYTSHTPDDLPALKSKIRDLIIVIKRKLIHELKQHTSLHHLVEAQLAHLEHICTPCELSELADAYICQCVALCESGGSGSGRILDAAVSFISKNFTTSFSLEDMGHKLGVSSSYLSRLFKLRLGKNFIDYITELRIEYAKELLAKRDMSIKEITYAVGYNSQAYFCKVFRKITDLSASQYISYHSKNRSK